MTTIINLEDHDMAKAKKAARSTAKKKSSAKKPAAAKASSAKPASGQATAEDVIRMPSVPALKSLAATLLAGGGKIDDITGDMSGAVRELKKKGLHPAAFKDALKSLKKVNKDIASAALYLSHRDFYEDALGINKKIEDVPNLPMAELDEMPTGEQVKAAVPTKPQKAEASRPTVDMGGGTVLRPNFSDAGDEHLKRLAEETKENGPLIGKAH